MINEHDAEKLITVKDIYNIMTSLQERFPFEINIVVLLSQCPAGLSYEDITSITSLNRNIYGIWESSMKDLTKQNIIELTEKPIERHVH